MADVLGHVLAENDFLPPLSEEAADEVIALIGSFPQYHPSVASELGEEGEDESLESLLNMNFYNRSNTRVVTIAQNAGYKRFRRLPIEEQAAEIEKDIRRMDRYVKNKERFVKTLKTTLGDDPNCENNEEDEEVEDTDSEEEEDNEDDDIETPDSEEWMRDWWKEMDNAWEEVYAHKIRMPEYKRTRAYSENNTYEEPEKEKKKRKEGRKNERVVQPEPMEEDDLDEMVVEEVIFDQEDDFLRTEELVEEPRGNVLQAPKLENVHPFMNLNIDVETLTVFKTSQAKISSQCLTIQEKEVIEKKPIATEERRIYGNYLPRMRGNHDIEVYEPGEDEFASITDLSNSKEDVLIENPFKQPKQPETVIIAKTPATSQPPQPELKKQYSIDSSLLSSTIDDPGDVTMDGNDFERFFGTEVDRGTVELVEKTVSNMLEVHRVDESTESGDEALENDATVIQKPVQPTITPTQTPPKTPRSKPMSTPRKPRKRHEETDEEDSDWIQNVVMKGTKKKVLPSRQAKNPNFNYTEQDELETKRPKKTPIRPSTPGTRASARIASKSGQAPRQAH